MTDGPGSHDPEGDPKVDFGAVGTAEVPSVFERDDLIAEAMASRSGVPDNGSGGIGSRPETAGDGTDPGSTAALIEVACGLQDLGSKQEELRASSS